MGVTRFRVAVLVCLISVTDSALGIPPEKEHWRRARTKHFTIISNDHPNDIEEVAREFERFQSFMLLRENANDSADRTTVFLFRDEKSFAPYKKNSDGKVSNFVGLFIATRHAKYIAMTPGDSDDPFRTVYHEYTHYYHSRKTTPLPLWFKEGMAEYLSTFRSSDNRVQVGQLIDEHVSLLRTKPLMALGDLFAMTPDSPDYNEGERQGIFYAQSWALFHYMRHERQDLHEKLAEFVTTLNSGSSTKEAFALVYGVDYRSVEAGLKKYVRQARFGYHEYEIELQADESIDMQEIPRAELLAALGTYLVDAAPWQSEDADAHLRESLALVPAQPRLHAALGDVYTHQGRHVEARQQFDLAIRYGADDAMTQARYGHHLVDQYIGAGGEIPLAPTALPEVLVEARHVLTRAVQLNPGDGEAFASLGKTYLFDPQDTLVGLQTLSVARSLLPGRMDVAYYQVLLLMRMGDRASAEALTNQVLAHAADRELYDLARAALENAAKGHSIGQFNEAVDQFNMGKFARTLEILERLTPTLDDRDLRQAAEELAAQAREAQSEQASIDRLNAQITRYNTAVDRAEAGDLAAAQAILDELLNEVEDPDLARSTRTLLEQVRAALASRAKRP